MMGTENGSATVLPLPDYRDKSAEVAERFRRIYERPVVLNICDVGKVFETDRGPVTALDRISFRAHRRELICVIGASGCGKSTLARIVAGLDAPTSGRVLLGDREVRGPGRDRGMVFQTYTLFPWRTVLENVMFGLEVGGSSRHSAEEEAREWIEVVGLGRFAGAYPHELSGGMKQRVAIARALANQPRVLLMDEPFGALDAQTRAEMQGYLLQIWKIVDVTVLFVTHDLDEAVYLADRILVMGPHPGHLLEVVEVPLERPRRPAQLESPLFLATRRHLEALIYGSRVRTTELLPRFRFTQAGDDVE